MDQMDDKSKNEKQPALSSSFFARPGVEIETIPVGPGVPLGIERVSHPAVGIGGAYGAWGLDYDNDSLPDFIADRVGQPLSEKERLDLSSLGFESRHHIPRLSREEHIELETRVGARFLSEACRANNWEPSEVEAVLIGVTTPVTDDFTERIAEQAGIPASALKVSIHKACDGAVGGLNLALNPGLVTGQPLGRNLAKELLGKKVLVGGIEGLSRVVAGTSDRQALQLFANGAGVLGVIPGQTMKFLAGCAKEVFDEVGVLQLRMSYPHSGQRRDGQSLIEVVKTGENSHRVAGLMHEPEDDSSSVVMAGPMGMVKLFVRSGVAAVRGAYAAYQELTSRLAMPSSEIVVGIVHHANYKINLLKAKQLKKVGISIPMPWLLSDFGNVSAASTMIAFLRELTALSPGNHVLIDGFGAGTYYDVLAVEMGKPVA
jgi:3-oxoacyl-[acyl-carrier-protein] synthase III